MKLKGEGGMLEMAGSHGLLIFAILFFALIMIMLIAIIASNPDLGIKLPALFGGGGE